MARLKKISKKKLKDPDEFMTITARSYLFISHHRKPLLAGGIVFLILVLSVSLYFSWKKGKEAEASQRFRLAMDEYQMVNSSAKEDSSAEYKNVLGKFDEVIAKFPRTLSGEISLLYKGNILLQLDQFEEATKTYQAFLDRAGKQKPYRLFAMEGLGYCYEGKKDYEKAIETYQKIVQEDGGFQVGDAYLNLGRCYEKLGKSKEALENYKAFLKVSRRSVMINSVLRKISILEN